MSADNRLTAAQLAAMSPGDAVVIETGAESGQPRHTTGTVVRTDGPYIAVSVRSPRAAAFIEEYRRRDGSPLGGRVPAELVNTDAKEPVLEEAQRRTRHIDSLFRDWARHRTDVDRLRALHEAIGECLEGLTETVSR